MMQSNEYVNGVLIRAASLTGFKEAVLNLGGDPNFFFQQFSINPESIQLPNTFIPYQLHCQVLQSAAEALGCAHFGALVGTYQNVHTLGAIGLLMTESGTVGEALQSLHKYHHLYNQAARLTLETEGDHAFVSYTIQIHLNYSKLAEHALYKAAIAYSRFMRMLCGDDKWSPDCYHFTVRAPSDTSGLSEILGAPVEFNQARSGWVFSRGVLKRKIDRKEENLKEILTHHVEMLNQAYPYKFSGRVASTIRSLLPTGECTKENVAKILNVSARTLQRKMGSEGQCFRQLLENIRKEIFEDHIKRMDISMTEIAYLLGYSDSSSFSRSFKKWYGIPPSLWGNLHSS